MNIGFILLADHAEAVNGKLYMNGGGWNMLSLGEVPQEWRFHMALGVDISWNETNIPHELQVTIQDPDGQELGEGLTVAFETGRPPGTPAGQDQRLVIAVDTTVTFSGLGPHAAIVEAGGEELGRTRFYVTDKTLPEGHLI